MLTTGFSTSTEAEMETEPPGPEQVSWNGMMPGVLSAPEERVPEVLPAVKPPPVQEVAFVEDQVRVTDCPMSMLEGLAESETVGENSVHPSPGFTAPLLHCREPVGLYGVPPAPEQPEGPQEAPASTQDWPMKARPSGHWSQAG